MARNQVFSGNLEPAKIVPAVTEVWRPHYGRVFRNVEEVRTAVTEFKDRYNRHWRLEKLGFMSPREARQAYAIQKAA